MKNPRDVLRLDSMNKSLREIASILHCSKDTAAATLKRAKEAKITWETAEQMTDEQLRHRLYPARNRAVLSHDPEYMEYLEKELSKKGVTKKLLWTEYCQKCRNEGTSPLMYSAFCHKIQRFRAVKRATMRISLEPSSRIEVDWCGATGFFQDERTGKRKKLYYFVGVLAYSLYTYVEACEDMKLESWIRCHVNMFTFFGGSAKELVPDNLAVGVTKPSYLLDPQIHRTYQDLGIHYSTAIVPARVFRPKDKNRAEAAVNGITTWLIAALRHEVFFSVAETNAVVKIKLQEYNAKAFSAREGSRQSVFEAEEQSVLTPLPAEAYQFPQWKKAIVQPSYHICVLKQFYSTPYQYIGESVDVKITLTTIAVFWQNRRIAEHQRDLETSYYRYHTNERHMPDAHRNAGPWDRDRLLRWAASIGTDVSEVITRQLDSKPFEQQAYRTCLAILHLSKKYSGPALQQACSSALAVQRFTPPSYSTIKLLIHQHEASSQQDGGGFLLRGSSFYEQTGDDDHE